MNSLIVLAVSGKNSPVIGKSREYLSLCQRLQAVLRVEKPSPGQIVARGFADVGFEEFVVLPSGSLVSIMSGQSCNVSLEELQGYFFAVPDVDELVALLDTCEVDILDIAYLDQRTWVVQGKQNERVEKVSGKLLEEALVELLAHYVQPAALSVTPKLLRVDAA